MSAQTKYGFSCPKGLPGGLYDLSAHEVASRCAEGKVSFGAGVVTGTNKGTDVALPVAASSAGDFEGVIVHNSVMAEMDLQGTVEIGGKRTVGCLQYGRVWVKTGKGAKPAYRETVYLITAGEEAGLFTTASDAKTGTKVAVNGVFLGETDEGIANAAFFPAITETGADTETEEAGQ